MIPFLPRELNSKRCPDQSAHLYPTILTTNDCLIWFLLIVRSCSQGMVRARVLIAEISVLNEESSCTVIRRHSALGCSTHEIESTTKDACVTLRNRLSEAPPESIASPTTFASHVLRARFRCPDTVHLSCDLFSQRRSWSRSPVCV